MTSDPRKLGSIVALLICSVIIVAGAILEPSVGWLLGGVGVPVSVALAWQFGPEAVAASGTQLVATGIWFGVKTIVGGVVGLILLALFGYIAGVVLVGIPVAIIVIPAALIWAVLVRAMLRPRYGTLTPETR